MTRRVIPVLLSCAALGLAACGSDDGDSTASGSASTPAAAASTGTTAASSTATTPPEATSTEGAAGSTGGCKQVKAQGPVQKPSKKPTSQFSKAKSYTVTMETSCGTITIALDVKGNPKTATSFGTLVKGGFYDGLGVVRVVPDFVLQAGDPEGNGTGGPSYSVVEAPPADFKYPKYTVAMAKTGAEAPGTSGSQFFIMTGDSGLPPEYAVAGKVTGGKDVVDAIGAIPPDNGQDGPPTQPVIIEKATLSEK